MKRERRPRDRSRRFPARSCRHRALVKDRQVDCYDNGYSRRLAKPQNLQSLCFVHASRRMRRLGLCTTAKLTGASDGVRIAYSGVCTLRVQDNTPRWHQDDKQTLRATMLLASAPWLPVRLHAPEVA